MREEDIATHCLSLIQDITGRDHAQAASVESASVFELGIDSLSIITLIFALEERLNIEIPLSDLDEKTFSSVRNLSSHLSSLCVRRAA